jgi:hypothetical protein
LCEAAKRAIKANAGYAVVIATVQEVQDGTVVMARVCLVSWIVIAIGFCLAIH